MKRSAKKKAKRLGIFYALILIILAVFAGFIFQIYYQVSRVDIEALSSYTPTQSTKIYSADGELLVLLHRGENRLVVPLSKISPNLQKAVIATEDSRFYSHHGIDFHGILRAGVANLVRGGMSEGGSTLTQQLARNLFLYRRKTFIRKIAEIFLALKIERNYTKDEILEMYLNQIYWGHNAYGAEAASEIYFGHSADSLTLAEAAMLAGILRAPELYSPHKNFLAAKLRQAVVLNRMVDLKIITQEDAMNAQSEEIKLRIKRTVAYLAPYFTTYVISQLLDKYGEEMVYAGGLKVYTTLNMQKQNAAEAAVTRFVNEEGTKYKFSQAALVAIEPQTGYIKAMVGGASFEGSEFNRTVQAQRQPGSAFKPFIYTAAMEEHVSPGYILDDTATTWEVPADKWNPKGKWRPMNFDKKFRGKVTLRQALEASLNMPSIKLLEKVGIGKAINVAQKMGIKSPLEWNLALTLGASEVNLLEMTSAYGVFADSGIRVEPVAILKVEGSHGEILERHTITENKVLDSNIAAVMVDLMKGVILRGTGFRANIGREAAAKTGTTEQFKDAWFIGYVPQLSAGVWVGNDNNSPMKGVAEVSVCPRIWKAFMVVALEGEPALAFPKPKGLTEATICLDCGKLATEYCPQNRIIKATFWSDEIPTDNCDVHKLEIMEDKSIVN